MLIAAVIFEIIVTVCVMWGIWNEEKLIRWEHRKIRQLKERRCK